MTESLTGLVQSNINEDRDLLEKVNTIFVAEKSDEIIGNAKLESKLSWN